MLYKLIRRPLQRVRMLHVVSHRPCQIIDSHLYLSKLVADTEVDSVHLGFDQFLHRIIDNPLRCVVHHTHCQLQQYCSDDDHGQRKIISGNPSYPM